MLTRRLRMQIENVEQFFCSRNLIVTQKQNRFGISSIKGRKFGLIKF